MSSNLRENLVIENQGVRSSRCWTKMMKLLCQCVPQSHGEGSEAVTYGQALGMMSRQGGDDENRRPTSGALTFEEVGAVWYVMPPLLCGTFPKRNSMADQPPQ